MVSIWIEQRHFYGGAGMVMKRFVLMIMVLGLAMVGNGSHAADQKETTYSGNNPFAKQWNMCSFPCLTGQFAVILNADSGLIYYEKQAFKKTYPASTTKILTALLAMENSDLKEPVTVGSEINSLPDNASTAGLTRGEVLTMEELLYALMLPSGNDAAYVIAAHIGRKMNPHQTLDSQQAIACFIAEMNRKAAQIGCRYSHFANPDGYHHPRHYTSAYDLALITRAALNHSHVRKVIQTRRYSLHPSARRASHRWRNSNRLLHPQSVYYYPLATGVKTGYTGKAGNCLVTSASQGPINLICVVLKSTRTDIWKDSTQATQFVFNRYSLLNQPSARPDLSTINSQADV